LNKISETDPKQKISDKDESNEKGTAVAKNTSKIDALRESNFNFDESDVEVGFNFLEEKPNCKANNDKNIIANILVNEKIIHR
jgi:hypothetical protein